MILTDDQSIQSLSTNGWATPTPNMDFLIDNGASFTQFHTSASCTPTRVALLTGKYPQRSGIYRVPDGDITSGQAPSEAVTLAEIASDHGYYSALFGKWHVGYTKAYRPTNQGFLKYTGAFLGVDYFNHVDISGNPNWWQQDTLSNQVGHADRIAVNECKDFIATNDKFFICLWLQSPHNPFQPESGASTYENMVSMTDGHVGEIYDQLQAVDKLENTLIVFMSDNGGAYNDHNLPLKGKKGNVFQGGINVPLSFYWEGHISPTVSDGVTIHFDVFKTICDYMGWENDGEGLSLRGAIENNATIPDRYLFWYRRDLRPIVDEIWKGVRFGNWKYTYSELPAINEELYDLSVDPNETTDLEGSQPGKFAELKNALSVWESTLPAPNY